MGSHPITFLWLWPATDHEPHCRHVPIYKIWRWTESTSRSGWWCSHVVGIYGDCSTREINKCLNMTLCKKTESLSVVTCRDVAIWESELSMGPFLWPDPTQHIRWLTQPTTSGKIWTQHNTTNNFTAWCNQILSNRALNALTQSCQNFSTFAIVQCNPT